jgi:hypothetical protein
MEWFVAEKDAAKVRAPAAIIKVKPRECRLYSGGRVLRKGSGGIDECE